ncbi:MAG TPA: 3-deoxy-D-manno-octulosonic acid transferase [Rhodospirillaceae bacterium]|nr:3-deoxy-D-manno-octulosonic acid transferase [Rhodospirillaceae bacterium]
MILTLYRGLTTLGAPLISYYLRRRLKRGKEDGQRFGERLGQTGQPRPPGRLVWLHAASVGESVSMLPVIERLLQNGALSVLVTTGTVSSADLMAKRLPVGALHQYAPVDRLAWVRRFLDHWKPDLALWAESEFWPNLVTEAAARNIPMILLNGRISDRSFARWRRQPRLIRKLLSGFVLCLGQTPLDSQRLTALGARQVAFCGNLKFAAPPLPVDSALLSRLAGQMGDRPRWLAASTHAGEELMAGRLHLALAAQYPRLLTIIAPRHPNRADAVRDQLVGLGLKLARHSDETADLGQSDVLLVDTLGELGLFMRLSPIVFMGKSMLGQGGQNPLEPARLGASVLFGPHMENFQDIARRMENAGAALRLTDETALAEALRCRLGDPALVTQAGDAARAFATAEDGVLDCVFDELRPWLSLIG